MAPNSLGQKHIFSCDFNSPSVHVNIRRVLSGHVCRCMYKTFAFMSVQERLKYVLFVLLREDIKAD